MSGQDEPDRRATPAERPRLTDSPWFWLLIFANAAIVGLALIGPKYNLRQGAVERRYEARQEISRRQQGQGAVAGTPEKPAEDDYSPLANSAHIVPLRPLAVTLVLLNSVAIVLFCMNHLRQARPASTHQ